MKDITFVRYSPHTSDNNITAQVVECYRQVFADAPWNEWKQCSICKKYWGIKDRDLLKSLDFKHCGIPLGDFWLREQVMADLSHEITEDASCWLALNGTEVIGFCWGYPISLESLEKKLGLALGSTLSSCDRRSRIAYQDEVGVITEFRGQKIAKSMVKRRLLDFLEQGLEIGVVRTREYPEPSETFLWYLNLGYEIVGRYPDGDGRVVLARSLKELPLML